MSFKTIDEALAFMNADDYCGKDNEEDHKKRVVWNYRRFRIICCDEFGKRVSDGVQMFSHPSSKPFKTHPYRIQLIDQLSGDIDIQTVRESWP